MKNFISKYWFYLVIFIAGFLIGKYGYSKAKIETVEVVKYVPSPYPVEKRIEVPVPYAVKPKPTADIPFPETITIKEPEVKPEPSDTGKVYLDYWLTRYYKLDFSNDTLGTYLVDAEVNQNRIVSATAKIQPMVKVVDRTTTIYKKEKLQFYLLGGTSADFSVNKLQFGVDLNQKYLLGISGIRMENNYLDNNNNIVNHSKYNYTIDVGVKF